MGRPKIYENKQARLKAYYDRNKEKLALWRKEYNKSHKEEIKIANDKWRKKNIKRCNEMSMKAYRKRKIKNPDKVKEDNRKNFVKTRLRPEFAEQQRIRHTLSTLYKRRGYNRMCEICEVYGAEIHHQDYRDPYDIIFLCHKCHIQLHKLLKGTDEDPQILYERNKTN